MVRGKEQTRFARKRLFKTQKDKNPVGSRNTNTTRL